MKRGKFLKALSMAAVVASLTACDAIWTSDMVGDPGYYIGSSYSSEWYPPLPGAPLINPVYWGNQLYPGPIPVRPSISNTWRPTGNVRPVNPGNSGSTSTPVPLPDNIPVGNGGNAGSGNSRPSNSVVPPAGTFPNIGSAEPGIAMPPAGTGYRTRK
ncbi:MAG: hypothetical protein NC111_04035 [Bacteroides sp.]|nr:hypothetical protein [Bacteroides sp.]MCM1412973.1 hypothetical protein [Bacteroides sp.]MCM1471679.1 hypothetical protein [Bacteroides sp.]